MLYWVMMTGLVGSFLFGYWYRGWVHTITFPPSTGESLVE
jgi:hypothetical protein